MRRAVHKVGVVVLATLPLVAPLPAYAAKEDEAAGRVVAALKIADACKGIGKVGQGDNQSFVITASDMLKSQGYRGNRMRTILFYAETASLDALAKQALAERGVEAGNTGALCSFGRKVGSTSDPIGQFLVKGTD